MTELFKGSKAKIKLALPKGSLQDSTFEIFQKAGFDIRVSNRSLYPNINDEDIDVILLRAQEIGDFIKRGIVDAGITGKDWITENEADLEEVLEMRYAKTGLRPVKWVIAVPEESDIKTIDDLEGKSIATEAVKLVESYLKQKNISCKVTFSWGATEIKAPLLVDAIADVTETGNSIRANNLRIIDTIMESTPRLVCNKESWKDEVKRTKLEELAMLLKGAIVASTKVGMMMNVKKKDIAKVLSVLPALQNPTISDLADPNWSDIITIVDKDSIRELIPKLKRCGASGIVEYPLNKIID